MQGNSRRAVLGLLFGVAAAVASCGGGGGGDAGDGPPAQGPVASITLKATQNRHTYHVQVFVPENHAAGTATLPAIYVTEGDAPFGAAGESRFTAFRQVMQRRGTQAILVGISGTARRTEDFLLPGAADYLHFIAKDLAPEIERQWRADPAKRMLSGLSHGGYFVVAALVIEGSAGALSFSHYLSTDSSYGGHANVAAFLTYEQQLDASGKAVPATLFLAGSSNANGPTVVTPLHAQMAAHAHAGLTLLTAQYATSHVGSDLPAFEEALTRFVP